MATVKIVCGEQDCGFKTQEVEAAIAWGCYNTTAMLQEGQQAGWRRCSGGKTGYSRAYRQKKKVL